MAEPSARRGRKANACRICGQDSSLQFKTFAGHEWWIHCDSCGNHSESKPSRSEAGEQWNRENP